MSHTLKLAMRPLRLFLRSRSNAFTLRRVGTLVVREAVSAQQISQQINGLEAVSLQLNKQVRCLLVCSLQLETSALCHTLRRTFPALPTTSR